MVIVLKEPVKQEDIDRIVEILHSVGAEAHISRGEYKTLIGVIGDREKVMQVPEIVECHHITGKYSLLAKIYARNNEHLKQIIVEKIQSIPEIVFTETFISLEEGFIRPIAV